MLGSHLWTILGWIALYLLCSLPLLLALRMVKKSHRGWRIALWSLLAVLSTAAVYTVAGLAVLTHIDRHFEAIKPGMTIAEVKETLGSAFTESDVALETIEKDENLGVNTPSFPDDERKNIGDAKKYSYRILKKRLYFYVIYDNSRRVREAIPVYE